MQIGMMEARPPYVQFEMRAQEDRQATIETGRYVAKNVAFALVTPAGTKDMIERIADEWLADIEMKAFRPDPMYNPQWAQYFRSQYEQWKKGEEIPENGTPIKGWAAISPAEQQMILQANIRTVEDLAEVTEQGMQNIGMGARNLKEKAVAWLKSAEDHGKIAQEVAAMKAENEDLKQLLKSALDKIGDLESALKDDKPRRGRPPKE